MKQQRVAQRNAGMGRGKLRQYPLGKFHQTRNKYDALVAELLKRPFPTLWAADDFVREFRAECRSQIVATALDKHDVEIAEAPADLRAQERAHRAVDIADGQVHGDRGGVGQGGCALAALVQTTLAENPFSGHVFAFRGKRGDLVKLLWWSGDGMNLYAKRLERGRFVWPQAASGTVSLTRAQLSMLLEGIDWRRPERTWEPQLSV